ncbi:MAG: hypothetical protein ACRDTJ_06120, partial [Pseudonocardiaceae bacterium]
SSTENRRPAASARILLATIHVRAGEPHGPQLAHNAITAATKLSSDRVRQRLLPLADELDARRGSDYRELARMARQVATTQSLTPPSYGRPQRVTRPAVPPGSRATSSHVTSTTQLVGRRSARLLAYPSAPAG